MSRCCNITAGVPMQPVDVRTGSARNERTSRTSWDQTKIQNGWSFQCGLTRVFVEKGRKTRLLLLLSTTLCINYKVMVIGTLTLGGSGNGHGNGKWKW